MEKLRQLFIKENGPSYETLTTSVSFHNLEISADKIPDLTNTDPQIKIQISSKQLQLQKSRRLNKKGDA